MHSVACDGLVHVVWSFELKRRVIIFCLKNIPVGLIDQIKQSPDLGLELILKLKILTGGGLLTHG